MFKKRKLGISVLSIISFLLSCIALFISNIDGCSHYNNFTVVRWLQKEWIILILLSGYAALTDIKKHNKIMILSIIAMIPFIIGFIIWMIFALVAITALFKGLFTWITSLF